MSEKVLFVDDEASALSAIKRNLRKAFEVHLADGGEAGLKTIETEGPFPVIVSDMCMPGMNGAKFLAATRKRWPDSVRVLLTGHGDMDSAIAAVNEGMIFRFLTKPCSLELLTEVVNDGIRQYQLVKVEKELLENTLKGTVKVLADVLSLTNPVAFSRATRIREYVVQIAEAMQVLDTWQYEVAAILSQLGCVTIPHETIEKFMVGDEVTDRERDIMADHPAVARQLIAGIPRLEAVAEMIANQNRRVDQYGTTDSGEEDPVAIGGQILKVAIDFDALLLSGMSQSSAIEALEKKQGAYSHSILAVLETVRVPTFEKTIATVRVSDLRGGMVLAEDVRTGSNVLLVARGQKVSDALRRLLENFAGQGSIGDTVRAYVSWQPEGTDARREG